MPTYLLLFKTELLLDMPVVVRILYYIVVKGANRHICNIVKGAKCQIFIIVFISFEV